MSKYLQMAIGVLIVGGAHCYYSVQTGEIWHLASSFLSGVALMYLLWLDLQIELKKNSKKDYYGLDREDI